jgi:hypothetical protein
MDLKDVLLQLNSRVLEQLFKGPAWQKGNPEEIARYFIKEIPKLWGTLNQDEQKVLVYFLFCVPGQSILYRQMDLLAKSHSTYSIYRGLTGLRQKGIVFTHRQKWGELAFFIPDDLSCSFREFLWKSHSREGRVISFLIEDKEYPILCNVLFHILQTYRHAPISLTKKGELPAKVRRFWQELIPYPEELFIHLNCGKAEWFFIFMEELGLMSIVEKEGCKFFAVQGEEVKQLFQGNQWQVQKRLYKGIKRMYTRVNPFYIVIFEALDHNQWKACWEKMIQDAGWDLSECEWEDFSRKVLPLLQAFGCFLEEDNESWMEKAGYVQPTFEVLLLPNASYEMRWALGNYACLIQQQELWTFQLDKETITQVQSPNRKETLLTLLSHIQQGDLPENVVQQVHKWIDATEEVIVEKALLLRCSSKTMADHLASARIKGLGERINDHIFLVQATSLSLLQKELNKMEIQIKEGKEEEYAILSRKQEPVEESISVESIYPMLEDVLPEVKELPALWRKNRQKYHASTLRMFMEKASALGLPVHMEARDEEWEGIYINRLMQEKGVDMVYFTDGEKEYAIPLMDIGPIQMQI